MKIIFYLHTDNWGGAEKYVIDLANEFQKKGNFVFILFPGAKYTEAEKALSTTESHGIKLKRFGCEKGKYLRIRKHLIHIKPDIMHLNVPSINAYYYEIIAWISKCINVPRVVATFHLTSNFCPIRKKIMAFLFAKYVDEFITVSNVVRKGLCTQHNIPTKHIRIIYNGIEKIPSITPDEIDEVKRIIEYNPAVTYFSIIGRFALQKGHQYLFKSAALLKNKSTNFKIIVIGDGELKDKLKIMALKLGLNKNIIFCGYSRHVPAFISISDAVVITSTNEGFPFVAIESFALKTPVIAFGIKPMIEVLRNGECGYLVKSFDIEALQKILGEIIAGKLDHSKIISRAFNFYKESLTYENMINSTIEVYGKKFGL